MIEFISYTEARIENIEGSVGHFKTKLATNGTFKEFEHGAVIVATGAKEYQPKEYLYGEDEQGHHPTGAGAAAGGD